MKLEQLIHLTVALTRIWAQPWILLPLTSDCDLCHSNFRSFKIKVSKKSDCHNYLNGISIQRENYLVALLSNPSAGERLIVTTEKTFNCHVRKCSGVGCRNWLFMSINLDNGTTKQHFIVWRTCPKFTNHKIWCCAIKYGVKSEIMLFGTWSRVPLFAAVDFFQITSCLHNYNCNKVSRVKTVRLTVTNSRSRWFF